MLKSEIWGDCNGFLFLKIYLWKILIGKTKLKMKSKYKGCTNIFGYDLKVLDSSIFIPYKVILDFNNLLLLSEKKEIKFLSIQVKKTKEGSFVKIIDK